MLYNKTMAKIYTKTGDAGTTALFGGKRVKKSDDAVEAYGSVDELSSVIGFLVAKSERASDRELLTKIQENLYQIMAVLSGYKNPLDTLPAEVSAIEKAIDDMEAQLPKLTQFILPQGGESSSFAHIARTVCRRAERRVVELYEQAPSEAVSRSMQYLNRLSDFFFVFARTLNDHTELLA